MLYRRAIGVLSRLRVSAQTTAPATCRRTTSNALSVSNTITMGSSSQCNSEFSLWNKKPGGSALWILLYSHAAILLGLNGTVAFAENEPLEIGNKDDTEEAGLSDLRKIEDGSVISNIHTSKWRVYTDNGRNLSQQGKLEEAERYFVLALQEAKEGFGEKDPHVASACNNLAELFRVKKAFDNAEPLYLEAVKILEASFGPDDVRVGAAFHNLGQFYLVQRKLEKARVYYEQALKRKGRVLGYGHPDYADTMYHLGIVLYLEGKETESLSLIQDSIRILEDGGEGESMTCLRRLRYLSQIHQNSSRLKDAEHIQRKIFHIMELSKGWNSLETVTAAERLALTLQSTGSFKEAKELLQQCLDVRKAMLPKDHIQIGANMLHMARVAALNSNQLRKVNSSEASDELCEAKKLLDTSIRIARQILDGPSNQRRNRKDEHTAFLILLQSYIALGLLEVGKKDFQDSIKDDSGIADAEQSFRVCINAYKEAEQSLTRRSICNAPDVKTEYLSCLKHLKNLISESGMDKSHSSREGTLQELKDEIKRVETSLAQKKKS